MLIKVFRLRNLIRNLVLLLGGVLLLIGIFQLPVVQRLQYPMPYKDIVYQRARQFGVDPLLVTAVIREESKFMPNSKSAAGAQGVMQLMPDTAAWAAQQMGLKNYRADSLYQPEINITLGCWYLANLSKQFNNNLVLVLAAYNGGRGRVQDWLNSGQLNPHGQIDEIPITETRTYVKRVLQSYEKYKQLYPQLDR